MPKEKVTTNRNIQLAVFVIVILVIGGFVYSVVDAAAMRQELKNVNEKVSSVESKLEENEKELKRQQTSNHEDESPPLKKKKQPTRKEFREKLKNLMAKTGKTVTAKRAKLASESAVTEETKTSKTATAAAVSTSKSTDTSETATPATSVPGPTATPTPNPTAVPKETATPGPTSEPVATSTATPEPTKQPKKKDKPITVEVINDNAVVYKDDNETEVLAEPKEGEKLTNVTEHEYGMLKVTYKGEEGFVDYKDTDYLKRKGISSPIYEVQVEDETGIICEEGVELRTKPGCTSQSEVIAILEGGMRFIALSNAEMLEDEYKGYYKVLILATGQEGYVDGRKLDFDAIEIKVSKDNENNQTEKEEDSKSTETSWETGLTVKVVHPMKMHEGDTTKSKVLLELEPDENLFDVQETTESDSGMLMVKCKRGNKVIKGFVEYLNTDYLDQIKRYDSVYQKKLDNVKTTVNANSVNLRDKPGITKKSKVVGVADKNFNLILVAYEEVVRYEKYGWFKAIVEGTDQVVYIYGKFVDVDMKEVKEQEEKETTKMQEEGKAATGSAITANEEDDNQTKTKNATTGSSITASKDGDNQTEKTTSQEYRNENVPKSNPIKKQTDIYFDRKMFLRRIMRIIQRKWGM